MDRDEKIERMFRSGVSGQKIGDCFGISRERVRQILQKRGVKATEGGYYSLRPKRQLIAEEKRVIQENKLVVGFGCKKIEARNYSRKIKRAYQQQRHNAARRNIEWDFTLPEWWDFWQKSGKWELRGRGKGYCMARFLDKGPYNVGNVYICTVGKNFSDSYITKPWHERFDEVMRGKKEAPPPPPTFSVYRNRRDKNFHLYLLKDRAREYVKTFKNYSDAKKYGENLVNSFLM